MDNRSSWYDSKIVFSHFLLLFLQSIHTLQRMPKVIGTKEIEQAFNSMHH